MTSTVFRSSFGRTDAVVTRRAKWQLQTSSRGWRPTASCRPQFPPRPRRAHPDARKPRAISHARFRRPFRMYRTPYLRPDALRTTPLPLQLWRRPDIARLNAWRDAARRDRLSSFATPKD
jgi:hypothetical protein